MADFKQRLQTLRDGIHLTQEQAADKAGISPRALQSYERGERYPDFKGLIRLADFYGVSLDYLVGRSAVKERR